MRGISIAMLAVAACGFSARLEGDAGGGSGVDAPALGDAPPGQVCFGTLAYDRVCYLTADVPGGAHTYSGTSTIDTSSGGQCTGNQKATGLLPGNPCIIAYDSIAFTGAKLTIVGPRPVLFLATGASGITIDSSSVIDASSRMGHIGAGALSACGGSTVAAQTAGGFGGTYVELGGVGGLGDNNTSSAGGLPAPAQAVPSALHGGCPGGIGAGNDQHTPAMAGGAIAFVTASIAVDGLIAAAGDGGTTSGANNAGGNGGGAGGMIVLDAPAITGGGELDAKGGGGGEGRGGNQPADGFAGYYPSNRLLESVGGASLSSSGGDGGNGGPRYNNVLQLVNTGGDGGGGFQAGGGGGGGAAGVIIATSPITLASEPAPAP